MGRSARMNIKSVLFILFLCSCVFFLPAGDVQNWDLKNVEELKQTLLTWQQTSPEKALELAQYLIGKFPAEGTAYGAMVSIYSLKGQFDKAEEVLKTAVTNVAPNADFYLRLAHLYQRKDASKLSSLIESFKQREQKRGDYQLLLAKLYIIQGNENAAMECLKIAVSQGDKSVSTLKLLLSLLKKKGDRKAQWEYISSYTMQKDAPLEQRIEFFNALLNASEDYTEQDLKELTRMLLQIVVQINDFAKSRNLVHETSLVLIGKGKGISLAQIMDQMPFNGEERDYIQWIRALIYRALGENDRFGEIVKNYQGANTNLLEEKTRLLESDGETTKALEVLHHLAGIKPADQRVLLTLAQFLNRHKRKGESQDVLDKITPAGLQEQLVFLYFALCFDNLSTLRRFPQIVNQWILAWDFFSYEHLKSYEDGILNNLPETDQHLALLTLVDEKLTTGSTTEIPLLMFKARLAKEIRDFDLYFATADRFLSLQKFFSSDLIYPYVKEALKRGLKWLPVEENMEPRIIITNDRYLRFAEKWLPRLIEKNPMIPDYHVNFIYILKARNKDEEVLRKISALAENRENDPERLHLVAYVLATSGFPQKALSYYEKAIALKPDMVRYKINYGGCLIRTKNFPGAIQVYRDIITGKYTAKAWDLAYIFRQLYYCYDKILKKNEFLSLLDELKTRSDIPPEALYLDAATVLTTNKSYDEAIQIVREFIARFPQNDMIFNAHMKMADIYVSQKKYDEAGGIYKECALRFKNDPIRVIDCLYNQGELEHSKGNYKEAIRLWTDLADKYKKDIGAQNALVSAAEVAEQDLKDLPLAVSLYRKFVSLNPKDPMKLFIVQAKLAGIQNRDR